MEKIILTSFDGRNISTNLYDIPNPKGIVQIIHGMKEHQGRYADFANFLNTNGFAVITSDLRGHGKDTALLGYMHGKKPWKALVDDQKIITDYLKEKYKDVKIYLFAHSMGTIIARNLIQDGASDYQKVILSGVPAYQAACNFGIFTANVIGLFRGPSYVSPLLEKLTLSPFEKAVKNAKTKVDWVSMSETNINNYLNDPYCNIPFTISAYKSLYHLVKDMHKSKKYKILDAEKPILMLVGALDPCPLGEKGLASSIKTLKKAGYKNVDSKVYPNMRHEILNEDNHQIVYDDILEFITK